MAGRVADARVGVALLALQPRIAVASLDTVRAFQALRSVKADIAIAADVASDGRVSTITLAARQSGLRGRCSIAGFAGGALVALVAARAIDVRVEVALVRVSTKDMLALDGDGVPVVGEGYEASGLGLNVDGVPTGREMVQRDE